MSLDGDRPEGEPRDETDARPREPLTGATNETTNETTSEPQRPAETNAMSTHDSTGSTGPTSDPTADPTSGTTADPTSGTTADPTSGPTTDPTADPTATSEIRSTSTQALPADANLTHTMPSPPMPSHPRPAPAPFRVEPSSPVPDDVVAPGSELPHLPAPAASSQPVSHPVPEPAHQPAPRPALVTVHKGPRPGSIMLGLLTVLVAAYLLLENLTNAGLGFAVTGPSFIGAFGGILLLVGVAGVVAGRLRRR